MILKGKSKEVKRDIKTRGSRKYGQARLKHSKKGMISCVCAAVIGLLLLLLVYAAYLQRGVTAGYIGGFGISAFVFAWVGIINGVKGLRERDKNYITCRFGIGFNSFFVLCCVLLFLRGLM